MAFELGSYLTKIGFRQTRDSDKRDSFEKDYYDPFLKEDYVAIVTIHHQGYYLSATGDFPKGLTISVRRAEHDRDIFEGLAPSKQVDANAIFTHVLPTL